MSRRSWVLALTGCLALFLGGGSTGLAHDGAGEGGGWVYPRGYGPRVGWAVGYPPSSGYGPWGYGPGVYAPPTRYYGNGGHDTVPHWHRTTTPFGGPDYWYGNGPHDYLPHEHTNSPYGGYRSYSVSPYGVTESFNQSTPYTYLPW